MKTLISLILLLLLDCSQTVAQTRIFCSAGYNSITDFYGGANLNLGLNNNSISVGSYSTEYSFCKYNRFDLTLERRLYGPFYWLSGIKFNQSGYKYAQGVYTSNLKNSYVSLPLLLRVNLMNGNLMYFDFGFLQNYLLKSDLKESVLDLSDHQDITRHLSRFSTSFYYEFSVAIKRFSFGMFAQTKAFGTSSDFSADWGLPRNNSLFLLYYRNYSFNSKGIKISYRLR
ncbi:MAG: hypothetical protein ACJ75J_09040 [Cytophagaceae bacterium]